MTKLDESERGLHLSKILDRKIGKLRDWIPPKIIDTIGPFEPEVFKLFDIRRREVVDACQAKLAAYSNDQIDELVFSDPLAPNLTENEWERFMEREKKKIISSGPPWYAAGFGHSDYVADFAYWSQCKYFSHHEALFLSLGVEPKHFTENQIDAMKEQVDQGAAFWRPLLFMLRRREQISRQFPQRGSGGKIYPKDLFSWFALVNLDVHPDFSSRYLTVLGKKFVSESLGDVAHKRPHKRELDKFAQLFTVMAIEYYGYRPRDARSPIPKEIANSAAKIGIEISDDTVRKYLRLGASFIPSDWKSTNG